MIAQHDPHQHMRDESHLRLLAIFHYVFGGLTLLGGIFLIGAAIMIPSLLRAEISASATPVASSPATPTPGVPAGTGTPVSPAPPMTSSPSPEDFDPLANFILFIYGGMGLVALALGILSFVSAKSMTSHKRHTLSLVVAGIHCLNVPLGTVLGVFTFLVLLRPSVSELYRSAQEPMALDSP